MKNHSDDFHISQLFQKYDTLSQYYQKYSNYVSMHQKL